MLVNRVAGLYVVCFFFLMIRRPPRSTQGRSSAASDVYKRQVDDHANLALGEGDALRLLDEDGLRVTATDAAEVAVSYTHLRDHETPEHLVCRLLLEKKKRKNIEYNTHLDY